MSDLTHDGSPDPGEEALVAVSIALKDFENGLDRDGLNKAICITMDFKRRESVYIHEHDVIWAEILVRLGP
jgi:hypothetical protein